ncbi:MAG: response regulator [Burkholderiaceae bacterium]|nr:MAG: response regulator [Burkholderiaceae bacterium]
MVGRGLGAGLAPAQDGAYAREQLAWLEGLGQVVVGAVLLAEYFGRHGFTVRQAEDAAAARRLVAEQAPELAILDVNMPGENGLSHGEAVAAEVFGQERAQFRLVVDDHHHGQVVGGCHVADPCGKGMRARIISAEAGRQLQRPGAGEHGSTACGGGRTAHAQHREQIGQRGVGGGLQVFREALAAVQRGRIERDLRQATLGVRRRGGGEGRTQPGGGAGKHLGEHRVHGASSS